jgi:hypothetical protein
MHPAHAPTPRPVEVVYRGCWHILDLPAIRHLLRAGLTTIGYTMLALAAHAHRMSVPELMAAALLESEARQ